MTGEPYDWRTHVCQSEIESYQKRVGEWMGRVIPDTTADQRALIVCEEAGELAHAILKRSQKMLSPEKAKPMIKDALGDIFFTLCGVAHAEGYDLEEIIANVVEDVTARTAKVFEERYA